MSENQFPLTATLDRYAVCFRSETAVALHECAHALAALTFGWPVTQISVSFGDTPDSGGGTWTAPPSGGIDDLRAKLVVWSAGGIAARLGMPAMPASDRRDRMEMSATARQIWGLLARQEDVDREIEQADRRAHALVVAHWGDILELAEIALAWMDASRRVHPVEHPQLTRFDEQYLKGQLS